MVISLSIILPAEALCPPSYLYVKKRCPLTTSKKATKKPDATTILLQSSPLRCSCSSLSFSKKTVPDPRLDKQVVKQNKLRFVQKLKTLLLSKPRHFMPLRVLSKCRSYLSLPPRRSILSMIKRYPAIFQLFSTPTTDLLAVQLTPAAESLASQEAQLRIQISDLLASKLQKLLMLSSHHRLLLSKLVHLASDLGLPPNFRSRLCNDHPDRFKIVDTSYGRALQLVSWDPNLAIPLPPSLLPSNNDCIIDRPPRFKHVKLRKGLNVKRKHLEFLIKFKEMPEVNPYTAEATEPHTMEAEKKACAVVREVLGLMMEKRTLVDHLTHFRHEFGLSNKVRGMLVRHPDLFYVSLKGQRDSVFLVEGYDDRGRLLKLDGDMDELFMAKEKLLDLVREGKRMRRERRNSVVGVHDDSDYDKDEDEEGDDDEEESDCFEDLFDAGIEDDWEDFVAANEVISDDDNVDGIERFWTFKASTKEGNIDKAAMENW